MTANEGPKLPEDYDWQKHQDWTRLNAIVPGELDVLGSILGDSSMFDCQHKLVIRWDQWAEATLTCSHGTYKGTSTWLNLTEAVLRAAQAFYADTEQHIPLCRGSFPVNGGGSNGYGFCGQPKGHDGEHRPSDQA